MAGNERRVGGFDKTAGYRQYIVEGLQPIDENGLVGEHKKFILGKLEKINDLPRGLQLDPLTIMFGYFEEVCRYHQKPIKHEDGSINLTEMNSALNKFRSDLILSIQLAQMQSMMAKSSRVSVES